jgi:hypothetical protein
MKPRIHLYGAFFFWQQFIPKRVLQRLGRCMKLHSESIESHGLAVANSYLFYSAVVLLITRA